MTTCRNCGATLHGKYCHACGQKAVPSEVTVRQPRPETNHTTLIVAIMFALVVWTIRNSVPGPPPKGLHLP